MEKRLVHVGIAVKSLDKSLPFYAKLFPDTGDIPVEEVRDQGVRVAFVRTGHCSLELTEATSESSPIARFIVKRGEGIHHLSFEVSDLREELDRLKRGGVRLIDETPRRGAGGHLIAFIHPSAANGVLIELSQKDGGGNAGGKPAS